MEQEYPIKVVSFKGIYSEPRKSIIKDISLSLFSGDEILDFVIAKTLTKSQWKTLCAKNNIRYITKV